jgi:GAF domain-containing protein
VRAVNKHGAPPRTNGQPIAHTVSPRPPAVGRGPRFAPEPWASRRGTPLSHSFCQHAVASREPLIVADSREHELLRDNPAIRDIGVIAYAGIPLIDAGGHALGTLCVIDSRPRHWTTDQIQLLSDLAASVVTEIAFAKAATQAANPA